MSESIEIAPVDVKAKLERGEPFLLLDCREEDEYAVSHINAAKLLPMSQLVDRVGELAKWKQSPIVVHCHKGMRSLRVSNWLREQGFEQVQSMAGGIEAWSVEIDPEVPRY